METYNLTDYTLPLHNYDIILKNGRVIDPASGLDGLMDVAIADGRIAAVQKNLEGPCFNIIDCSGKIVIPGFVDAHNHCYPATNMSLHPDTGGIYNGVPTVVDGGSSGYMTFPDFYNRYITRAATDVYAFLHFHPVGQYAHGFGHKVHPEVWDPALFKMQNYRVEETVGQYRDRILGLKNRGIETFIQFKGVAGLEEQLKLAEKCGLPYSIHLGEAHGEHLDDEVIDKFTQAVLERLRPGDIINHAFTDKRGFKPDIISSDFTYVSLKSVNRHFGLNLSRFLALGLSLTEVLTMSTINPARALKLDDRKGRLEVGRTADLSVLNVLKGDYTFLDYEKGTAFKGAEILSAYVTVREGRVYHVIQNGDKTP